MSLRRQLGVSMLIQGVGAASVLLATLWLGASLGPEQQGTFSRTKTEVEFLSAFAMFGLPQALFYFVKSARLSGRSALRWAAACALLALPIGVVFAWVAHAGSDRVWALALAAAAGTCVFHGQLRVLLLVRERTEWFNLLTALPQGLVLVGVVVLVAIVGFVGPGTVGAVAWTGLFAAAYGVTGALALWRLHGAADNVPAESAVGWREVGGYGLASWLTAVLSTAAVLLMLRWVEASLGAADLGRFTMAMTLLQVPLTPVGYAAPLLFRRWMEQPGAPVARRWAGRLFVALLAAAALVVWGEPLWPHLGLGAAYEGLASAVAVLLVGGAAEAASRLLGVHAHASGTPWIAVRAEAARWLVLGVGWALPLPNGLLPLCAVWAAAALAAAAVFALHGLAGRADQDGPA